MSPDPNREARDERGPDDERDERDERLPGDPRDERDPRTAEDARDPVERWGRPATRGQLFSVAAASATVTAALLMVGFWNFGASQDDLSKATKAGQHELCAAVQANQQQIRRVIDPALRFPDPVKARAEMDARTRAVYRRTLPNVTDGQIETLLDAAQAARQESLDEFPPLDCSGRST